MKCAECEKLVDKDQAVKYNNKNFHPQCYGAKLERQELFDYICMIFKLKKPGPKVNSQRRTFIDKYGFSDVGMLNALKYIYEVKKDNPAKAREGIGLIPYVYEEAENYFKQQERIQQEIAISMAAAIEQTKTKVIHIKRKNQTPKQGELIDLTEIEEEEE